jgi:NifU-like N terminal domain
MGQFSEILMDHFNSPRNSGRMVAPDRVGIAGTPGRGPYVALYLRLTGEKISEARFQTHGCGVSVASMGSFSCVHGVRSGKRFTKCSGRSAHGVIQAGGTWASSPRF